MPSSRRLISRLLTLLLVLLLGCISANTVNGSTGDIWGFSRKGNTLQGGPSFVSEVRLSSLCSDRYVQMGTRKKQGRRRGGGGDSEGPSSRGRVRGRKKIVNANGRPGSKYTKLKFVSQGPGGLVHVYGEHSQKYLCFNRKGRLIIRHAVTDDGRCLFTEQPMEDNTIMLQSRANALWYVGFNKRGRRMKGYRHQDPRRRRCYQFLKKTKRQNKKRHRHNEYGPMSEVRSKALLKIMQGGRRVGGQSPSAPRDREGGGR